MRSKWKKYISYRVKTAAFAASLFLLCAVCAFWFPDLDGRAAIAVPCAFLGLWLLGAWWVKRTIADPYRRCADTLQAFAMGQMVPGIFEQDVSLSPEQEDMVKRVKKMLNMSDMINATRKQAEYMALQNQINPHFLYNTLEGIRGETLHAGLDHVAQMTEALATFFRYTISNMENLVTLEEELGNIENYYIIQQYRFGDRLSLKIEYEEEDAGRIRSCRLPKLTLQPIVENAVCHGIEHMVGNGTVRIRIDLTDQRLIITVSDNGVGMSAERTRKLNQQLNELKLDYIKTDRGAGGGIAIVNVNNRIRLLCGEGYGIYIYSLPQMGTDVEITLPLIEDEAGT